jgi:hypothetical protein
LLTLWDADSARILPPIPQESCHPFHAKAATDSTASLPPCHGVTEEISGAG